MKYFERDKKRLIFIEKNADKDFWDNLWLKEGFKAKVLEGEKDNFVKSITKKYLSLPAKVLDGGCGTGRNVYGLRSWGYDAYGVDFAKKTINKINKEFPDLKIVEADVRNMPFTDEFFDGYWSFGVIEHFYDGYDEILAEMFRVLRKGGYIFITFPHISRFRKLKINLNLYPTFTKELVDLNDFYQYALDTDTVIRKFEENGFKLKAKYHMAGLKGLKDEVTFLKPILQKIYDSRSLLIQIIQTILNRIFTPISSHAILLVLQKND